MKIVFDDRIIAAAPDLEVVVLETPVVNRFTCDELWNEVTAAANSIATYKL